MDLEAFKLFSKTKLNLSQGTVYHYTSKIRTFMLNRKTGSKEYLTGSYLNKN